MTCNRGFRIDNIAGDPAGARIVIPTAASEFTMRAVDATDAPVAFEVAVSGVPQAPFHVSAGETFGGVDLGLAMELVLVVASAAGSTVELALWYA